MADSISQWQADTQNNGGRATAALTITIPITLSGKDANGVEFTQKARTIAVHRNGGKIATKCDLTLGSEMTLHNPVVGQTAKVRVLWVGEKLAGEEAREVGVQLLGRENIWGIEFPSYDRQKGPLQVPHPKLQTSRMPTEGANSPGPPSDRSSGQPKTNLPDSAKNYEAREGRFAEHVKWLEGSLHTCRAETDHLATQIEELKHAAQDEMAKALRQVQESRPKLVELALNDLEAKIREEIDPLANELIELTQKRIHEEVARAVEPLTQGALERVNSVAEENFARAGQQVQGLLDRLIQEGQAQLITKLQSTASEFQKEIHDLSRTAVVSAQAEIVQAGSKSTAEFQAEVQKTADEVSESTAQQLQKQAEDALLLSGEELKASTKTLLTDIEERLASAGGSALESVSSAADSALTAFQTSLDERVLTFRSDYSTKLEESLKRVEGEHQQAVLSGFQETLERQCAEALAKTRSELAQTVQDVSEQAARQASALHDLRKAVEEESLQTLANVKAASQAIGEVSVQIEHQAKAWKELYGEVQEESSKILARAKSDATQAIHEISEQAARDVEVLNNLRNSLVEESAQVLPKFKQDLEQVMAEVADRVQEQVNMLCSLQNLIEKESVQAFSQAKNEVAQALAEISLLAEQRVKSTQAAFSDWESQTGSRLESQLQQFEGKTRESLETLQGQSEELLKRTLERLRSDSDALPDQIEARLKQAAANVEQDWLTRVLGKQQQAVEEALEASATQLGKQLQENLDRFSEELKLQQEEAATGAAEAFRKSMVELLSVFQSPLRKGPAS